jgi:hypothetical protein
MQMLIEAVATIVTPVMHKFVYRLLLSPWHHG